MKGTVGKLLDYVYSKIGVDPYKSWVGIVKVDSSEGDIEEMQHGQPANITSEPLPEDYVISLPVTGTNRRAAVAFLDPEAPAVGPGSFKAYSRSKEDKKVTASLTLLDTGEVKVINDKATLTLSPEGAIEVNSLEEAITIKTKEGTLVLSAAGGLDLNSAFTVDKSGNVTTKGNIKADGEVTAGAIKLTAHVHGYVTPLHAGPEGNTNPPTG